MKPTTISETADVLETEFVSETAFGIVFEIAVGGVFAFGNEDETETEDT